MDADLSHQPTRPQPIEESSITLSLALDDYHDAMAAGQYARAQLALLRVIRAASTGHEILGRILRSLP